MPEFIRKTVFGHGSYGYECVLCGATDYSGKLEHEDGCLYAAIEAEINARKPRKEPTPLRPSPLGALHQAIDAEGLDLPTRYRLVETFIKAFN